MKLVPYDVNELGSYYRKTKNLKLLNEFADSGLDCAKVEDFTQKDARSCASALSKAIKHFRFGNIQVVTRKGCVFLVKTDD